MASNLNNHDYNSVWKDIKRQQNSKVITPSCIDGSTGTDSIVKMWREHYRGIFNSLTYSADDIEYINSKIQNVKSCHDMHIHMMKFILQFIICNVEKHVAYFMFIVVSFDYIDAFSWLHARKYVICSTFFCYKE